MAKFPRVVGASAIPGKAGLGGRAILQTNFDNLRVRMKNLAWEKAEQAAVAVILMIRQGMESAGGGEVYDEVRKKNMLFKDHEAGKPGDYPAILSGELVSSLRIKTDVSPDRIETRVFPQGLENDYPLALIKGIRTKSEEKGGEIHYFPWLRLGYLDALPVVTDIMTNGWNKLETGRRAVLIKNRAISDADTSEMHQMRVKAGRRALVKAQLKAAKKRRR